MLAGPLARASGQVSDRFAGVCDMLVTFLGLKTCRGQDSAITTCRDSASKFATGSLCFRRAEIIPQKLQCPLVGTEHTWSLRLWPTPTKGRCTLQMMLAL